MHRLCCIFYLLFAGINIRFSRRDKAQVVSECCFSRLYLRIQRGDTGAPDPTTENSQSCTVSKQYRSGSPEKSQSCRASIQSSAIIGPSAKSHLAISMAFRWRADNGPLLVVFGSSLPVVRVGPPSDKHFWILACISCVCYVFEQIQNTKTCDTLCL